jgi:hypothetical protein
MEERYYPNYEKISIVVFTENNKEKQKYFNLFNLLMADKIEKIINTPDRKEIITDRFRFRFFTKLYNSKGNKAHYVLNLTQDQEFNNCIVAPITIIFDYLKYDKKWKELFNGLD